MNHTNEHTEDPQSDVYVELYGVEENSIQKGIIFSNVNSLKQDCEVSYEPHEDPLAAGIYSFDLFYEPNITVYDAGSTDKKTEQISTKKTLLKLRKAKE